MMSDELRDRVRAQYGDGIAVTKSFRVPDARSDTNSCQVSSSADDARPEKAIVADADKRMRALGFRVWGLSQPRATKQSPGWPDRRYTHRERGIALWWEAKGPEGRQRPDQRVFQEDCEACGEMYVLGDDAVLSAWLLARYPLRWDEAGHLVWR